MTPTAELVFAPAADGRTALRSARVRAPLAFTRAFFADDRPPTTVAWLQSTNGALRSGEEIAVRIVVERGGQVRVSPQSATVVLGALDVRPARLSTELVVERDAQVVWAPQPTIMLPGARLETATSVHAEESATVVLGEIFAQHLPADACRRDGHLGTCTDVDIGGRVAADRSEVGGPWPWPAHAAVWLLGGPSEMAGMLLDAGFAAGALPNGAGTAVRFVGSSGAVDRDVATVVARMHLATTGRAARLRS